MTRSELTEQITESLRLDKALNVRKIQEGSNATTVYSYMQDWLLRDIEQMTGGKTEFDWQDKEIRFWLTPAGDTVSLFMLRFDRKTGRYLGPGCLRYRSRRSGESATQKEIKEAPKAVKDAFDKFTASAEKLEYLI